MKVGAKMREIILPIGREVSLLEWLIRCVLHIGNCINLSNGEVKTVTVECSDGFIGVDKTVFSFEQDKAVDFIPYLFEVVCFSTYRGVTIRLIVNEIDMFVIQYDECMNKRMNLCQIARNKQLCDLTVYDEKSMMFDVLNDIREKVQKGIIKQFDEISECISKKLFIGENVKASLLTCLQNLEVQRIILQYDNQKERIFPLRQEIIRYLNEYVKFSSLLLQHREVLEDTDAKRIGLFERLLNLDVNFAEGHLWVTLYSPYSLSVLANIYDSLYWVLMDKSFQEYTNIGLGKIIAKRLVRGFIRPFIHAGELFCVSVLEGEKSPIQAYEGRYWRDLSSCQTISITELVDKIVSFVNEKCLQEIDVKEIRVAIFGSTLLSDYLEVQERVKYKISNDVKVAIDVFKNIADYDENRIEFKYLDFEQEVLSTKFSEKYVNKYDLIFLLDIPQMYKADFLSIHDVSIEDFAKTIGRLKYSENYNGETYRFKRDGVIEKLGSQLIFSSLRTEKVMGSLCFELHSRFVDWLGSCVENKDDYTEICLYAVDNKEVDMKSWDRVKNTSLEFTSDSFCRCICLSNKASMQGVVTDLDRMVGDNKIVFSLEEVVQNIIQDSEIGRSVSFSNVKVCLSWDYEKGARPKNFRILWSGEKEKVEITEFLRSLFKTILSASKDEWHECVRQRFLKVCMRHIRTLRQLLVLHLIEQNLVKLTSCEYMPDIKDKGYNGNLQNLRMFLEIVRILDKVDMTESEYIYAINRARLCGENKDYVIESIKKVCEDMGFTESCLLKNLRK